MFILNNLYNALTEILLNGASIRGILEPETRM